MHLRGCRMRRADQALGLYLGWPGVGNEHARSRHERRNSPPAAADSREHPLARGRVPGPFLAGYASVKAMVRPRAGLVLQRWWTAWSTAAPPPPLQALINSAGAGCGLHPYIRN